jgi:CrcB protein
MGLVLVGAFFGVAGREGLSLAVPEVEGVEVVISLVNIVGAFLLGYLYEALARRAPGTELTAHLKLLLGTGFCGGFTTYSSLATDTALLVDRDRLDIAALYVLGTLVVGAAATVAGIAVADRLNAARQVRGGGS